MQCSTQSTISERKTLPDLTEHSHSKYPTFEFYGDEVTQGKGVNLLQRWTALVCGALTKEEINFAEEQNQWLDSATAVYNHHVPGRCCFFSYGINDVARGQLQFGEMKRNIYANIFFCCLRSKDIVNARTLITQTSGWTPNDMYETIGLALDFENDTDDTQNFSIQTLVRGRYIGFVATVSNLSDPSEHWFFHVAIDSKPATLVPFFMTQLTSTHGSSHCPYLYIVDTFKYGQPHTIKLTPGTKNGFNGKIYCDYFFGFDSINEARDGTKYPIFILEPTALDYHAYDASQNPPAGSMSQMKTYISMLQDVVLECREMYNLPVFIIKRPLPYDFGFLLPDMVCPNATGHRVIADKVVSQLHCIDKT